MNSLIEIDALADGLFQHWLKAGFLLIAAWLVIATCLRRSSASIRHVAWFSALVSAAILPVIAQLAPPIPVYSAAAGSPMAHLSPSLNSEHEAPARAASGGAVTTTAPAASSRALPDWRMAAVVIWFCGFTLLLMRLPLAWGRLARLSKTAKPMESKWTQLPVRYADQVRVPLVWGWKNPEILLPAEAQTWNDERVRSVLAHEEAHVRRRDPALQVLAELARAALWMQPLAWIALRQIRKEREAACDDAAIAAGVNPKQYANDLLEVAASRMSSFQTGALALAMAQRSGVGARIRGVLDDQRSRRAAGVASWSKASVVGAAMAVLLGALSAEDKPASPKNPAKPISAAADDSAPWSAQGTVVDENGDPLPGVELRAFTGVGSLRMGGHTTTDEKGRYVLGFHPSMRGGGQGMQAATIYAVKDGYFELNLCRQGDCVAAMEKPESFPGENNPWGASEERLFLPGEVKELNFQMAPAANLKGVLTDARGPLAERKIYVTGADLPPSSNVWDSTKTDDEGRFQFADLPTAFGFEILVPAAAGDGGWNLAPVFFKAEANDGVAISFEKNDAPMIAGELEIHLAGPAHDDYEERASSRSVVAEGGATIRLSGGGGIRVGGGDGLRLNGQGAMRSKRLKISLGGRSGGAINLQP